MSRLPNPNLPNTEQIERSNTGRTGREPRRESRMFSQIVPMSTPVQVLGPSMYPSIPVSPTLRYTPHFTRSSPTPPMPSPTTIPGLVLNPRTPENPVRYPASPHPRRAAAISRSVSPIAGPCIVKVPEDPQEASEDSVHSGGHAASLHLSEELPERDPAPSIHDGGSNNGDGGDGGGNDGGSGGGGAGTPPGPPGGPPGGGPGGPGGP
ncbi:hypothetical protein DFH07DRAFT_795964, partial [Mycena maculata]